MPANLSFEQRSHRRAFGDRVSALRRDRGWTQEQLAERADVHRSYIAGVESGTRNPTLDVIVKLSNASAVPEPLKDIAKAAAWVGVSQNWLREQVLKGLVPPTRIGQYVRFAQSHLDQIVAAGEHRVIPQAPPRPYDRTITPARRTPSRQAVADAQAMENGRVPRGTRRGSKGDYWGPEGTE